MAESECHSQGGQQNQSNSSSRSVLSPMSPGVGSHVTMAPASANHTSMNNMRSNIVAEARHMNMDGNIDKIYRKYACPTLVTPSTAASIVSGNPPAGMSLTVDANNPASMNPGEAVVGEGEQNLDKLYRKFPCPTCFKGFKSKQQLIQHNLVHTGARKYHCSYCDKSFKQLCHLQQHHRIHTGEKPYKCTLGECDRSFAQLSNLQHHLRNHDDQVKKAANKQHACVICHRSYTNESSLKSHTLKMHVHIKSLLPINDIPETANKSPKIQSKPVRGLYRPAIMVPIHQVTHSDWQTVGSDRILHKDLSQCKGSILKSVSCRQPIVIDSETSGSSGHSPYNGSYPGGYTPSSEDISSHVSNHNNSPVISLSDNHGSPPIASHREQRRGGQQQSSMYHHHHPHYHHHLHHQQQQQHLQQHKAHHQQPQYSDIHDQIQNVPAFTSLASSEANFTSSVHCHASLGAMTPDLSMSVNNYKYYSTGTTACPMSPAVSTIEREIHCYQPSLNQTEMTSLNFSPLRQ